MEGKFHLILIYIITKIIKLHNWKKIAYKDIFLLFQISSFNYLFM